MSFKAETVKAKAHGRWVEILKALAPFDSKIFNRQNQPCPACGGKDRFRFTNFSGNGEYVCNSCGNGDGFQLLGLKTGWKFAECLQKVGEYINAEPVATSKPDENDMAVKDWVPVIPAPENAPPLFKDGSDYFESWNPKRGKISKNKATLRHEYRDGDGRLLGYCVRYFIGTDGKKITPIITWCENKRTGQKGWTQRKFPDPAPLYGLDDLAKMPGDVLIVEGEKARDAAKRLLPSLAVVTWPGGTKRAKDADWTPLHGRKVIAWPDNDAEGESVFRGYLDAHNKLREGIGHFLKDSCPKFGYVAPFKEKAEGWDLADAESEGWTGQQVIQYIQRNVKQIVLQQGREETAPAMEEPPAYYDEIPLDAYEEDYGREEAPQPSSGDGRDDEEPPTRKGPPRKEDIIRPLGYDGNTFYYFPSGALQVRPLASGAHTKQGMMSLAPLDFWEGHFPKGGAEGIDWLGGANWLMQSAIKRGVFASKTIRGRGCWVDGKNIVMHLGERLLVNGKSIKLADFKSKYIYQREADIAEPSDKPLTTAEAKNILDAAKALKWEVEAHAALFAGWIALSYICGALRWRPHIWITGPAGSGKTTVMRDFLKALIDAFALCVQGETTVAGLRQSLKADAIPVLFDEAEGNEKKDRENIQAVLALMRASSTESGMNTLKGTAGHSAVQFTIRSMFCLSSIADSVKQKADSDRVSILSLKAIGAKTTAEKVKRQQEWESLKVILAKFNHEYAMRLSARSINLIPVIKENAEIFSRQIALKFGSTRFGDQYGHLLAGAYSLQCDEVIEDADAFDFIESFNWQDTTEVLEDAQEKRCLRAITESRLSIDGEKSRETLSIGEFINRVVEARNTENLPQGVIVKFLGDYGIKHKDGFVFFANQAGNLQKILQETAFAFNWRTHLSKFEGSIKPEKGVYFGPALGVQRAVGVPESVFYGETKAAKNDLANLQDFDNLNF